MKNIKGLFTLLRKKSPKEFIARRKKRGKRKENEDKKRIFFPKIQLQKEMFPKINTALYIDRYICKNSYHQNTEKVLHTKIQ